MSDEQTQELGLHEEGQKEKVLSSEELDQMEKKIREILDQIVNEQMGLAQSLENFAALGASTEDIDEVKRLSREKEVMLARILKKKKDEIDLLRQKREVASQSSDQEVHRNTKEELTKEALMVLDTARDLPSLYAALNILQEQNYVFKDQNGNPLSVTPGNLREKIVDVVIEAAKSENYSPQGILYLIQDIPSIADLPYKVFFDLTKDLKDDPRWLTLRPSEEQKSEIYRLSEKWKVPLFNYNPPSEGNASSEPTVDDAIPKEKTVPKPESEKLFSPEDFLTDTQKKRQKDINIGIDSLRVRYSKDNPSLWMEIVSNQMLDLLDVKNALNPKRKEAEAWFDSLMADLKALKRQEEYDRKVADADIWFTNLDLQRQAYRDKNQSEPDALPYYKILGISKSSDGKAIRKAFFALSELYHPDIYKQYVALGGKTGDKAQDESIKSEAIFKEINEAYQTLIDVENRQKYDQWEPYRQQQVREEEQTQKDSQKGDSDPQREQQNVGRETVQALNMLRNASDIEGIKSALRDLIRLDYRFAKGPRGNNPYDTEYELAATTLRNLELLESQINKGHFDLSAFNTLKDSLPEAEKLREKVFNLLEPTRQILDELDIPGKSIRRIVELLTELENKDFVFDVVKSDGERVTRNPSEMKMKIQEVERRFNSGDIRSPQDLIDSVNGITSLYDFNFKVLFELKDKMDSRLVSKGYSPRAVNDGWKNVRLTNKLNFGLSKYMVLTGKKLFTSE